MRVAVVEPYLGGSHAAWALGYQAHSSHDVVVFSHRDRFWKWRMHGAHVTLAAEFAETVATAGPCEVVVASSMLNTAGFLGLARQAVGSARIVVFMHENQLGYPLSPRDSADLTYPMINWVSMVAADVVVFNSEYHHRQWFEDITKFLRQFPDYHQHGLVGEVAAKSVVLPVGIDLQRFDGVSPSPAERPRVLWNQRWEYDKGTAELARSITVLADRGVDFELALLGEQAPTDPSEFVRLQERLGDRLVHYGWAEPDIYVDLLAASDVVVSTAHHEFFGISVTEAVYAGAFPVLPNRVVYPERIPEQFHDACLYEDEDDLVDKLQWAIDHPADASRIAAAIKPAMATSAWPLVAPRYDTTFTGIA